MKRRPVFWLGLFAIASITWVAGCRSPESPPASQSGPDIGDLMTREETPDFNDEFGGFNLQDDAVAFGDALLVDELAADVAYADPFATDADVTDEDRSDRPRRFLMITWGNLHRDEAITHRTDWSGALTISSGAIVLKRVIRFEPNDKILERTRRDLLEWESMTGPSFDGILVRVIPRPADNSTSAVTDVDNVVLAFKTGPVSVRIPVSDLHDLHRVIMLDDGNAVAFNTIELPPSACPHGLMRGVWANHPERAGGFFLGKWGTPDGKILGFIRGIYGTNDAGDKVFFGKMIDLNGRFEGLVKGEWGTGDSEHGGWYAGRWVDRNLGIRGGLKGNWERSPHCNGGFFRGEWAKSCDSISTDNR